MCRSSRKLDAVETENGDVKGNTTEDPGSSGVWKLERNSDPLVEKKPKFDFEKTKEINKKLEKLRIGSCTNSLRNDLKKKKKKGVLIFSEESRCVIYDMVNLELIELRQTSATMQCLSCLKHVPEGLNMCQCGVWLRPNLDTMDRIKARFAALITPFYRATIQGRGRKHGHNHRQKRPC